MECFNCNQPATKQLSLDADFGFLNVCDSTVCKEKVESDLKRFQEIYENSKERQGRTKQQVQSSEQAMAYAIIGCSIILFILTIISFLKK
jgi:hypothetical protein